jgi:hypothetical protein
MFRLLLKSLIAMDKYVMKRKLNLSTLFISFVQKLLQRPDYYAIKHYQKLKREKYNWLTH